MKLALHRRLSHWIKPQLLPLLVVNFIGALGYSIILPILVFMVQDFGGNAVLYGLVGSIYPAFQMVGAPVLGAWSDRVGRKKVLLLSQAGTFISWLIFLLAFALPVREIYRLEGAGTTPLLFTLPLLVLMAARAFDGLTGGNISVANAYLADLTEPAERKENYGKLAAAMNVGFIIGPALSGLLAALPNGQVLTVVAAAVISLAGIFVIHFLLPDVPPLPDGDSQTEQAVKKALNVEHRECRGYREPGKERIWELRYFPFFVLLYFLIFLAFNFFYATFPVHASDNLDWNSARLGVFFTVLSFFMILTQTFVLPRLSRRHGDVTLFMAGCFVLVGSFALLPLSSDLPIYGSAMLYGLGNGIMWPSFLSMLSQLGNKRQQGRIQGIAGSAGSLASIIGLVAGGLIFSWAGENIFLFSAGGLLLIGLLGGWRLRRRTATTNSIATSQQE